MDFEIPDWGNESFSYHFTSSLDQTIIDTAVTEAGEKRKKRKKKSNKEDDTLSPNKKLKQNNLKEPKSSFNIRPSPNDENEANGSVKLNKTKKLKTNVGVSSSIEKKNPSIGESNEFQNSNLNNIDDNTLIENSVKKSKSKKNKKSGKNNKYKELNEKQQIKRNTLITSSEKTQHESKKQISNSTMTWSISENKTQNLNSPRTDPIDPKENEVVTNKSQKKKKKVKKDSEILDTETKEVLHQTVSRKPTVKNENTEKDIETEIKSVKKRKKKKNKVKKYIEDQDSQEMVDVADETKNILNETQKRNKLKEERNNTESKSLANDSEVILKKKKKKKKITQEDSEEGNTKNKKKKSVKISIEHDLEVIEDENEGIEDSDLKAELERYLRKLKSKTTEELFATDSEDEISIDKGNESKDEWESLEEDDDDDNDEPGDDLESSGDVKEEVDDNTMESKEEKDDIQCNMEEENIDFQADNDIDSEDKESNLDDEDENDTNSNDGIDNEVTDCENETDSNEDENDTDANEDENDTDGNEDENDTDGNEDENELDIDDSESEEEAEEELDIEEESSKNSTSTSMIVENKDGKKKKFDSEKLTALLQESESSKESPKKLSPAEALRQKMSIQLNSARFRLINEQLYTSTGDDAKNLFQNDPEAFQVYHEGYKSQVAKWPINPLDLIIKSLKSKPAELVVADFGCGEAKLSRSVPQKKVFSLDLQAACDGVIVTDMAHTPLKTASVDIAVFCLSLMGTNIRDYVFEANRVLKQEGILKIAEVESRFTGDISTFVKVLEKYGFKCTAKDTTHKYFYLFDFKKTWVPKKSISLPDISLKPCIYKKR